MLVADYDVGSLKMNVAKTFDRIMLASDPVKDKKASALPKVANFRSLSTATYQLAYRTRFKRFSSESPSSILNVS